MHGFQSSSCCVELGDRRVLQSEVENEEGIIKAETAVVEVT